MKQRHEFRDPVHQFINVNRDERCVIDSEPVQRLREVHQLAMSYLVYPGATHRRFEHSLGVMELAGQVFDVISEPSNLTDAVRDAIPEVADQDKRPFWRSVVRLAALCHDIGHLPFSHAAEHEMLPEGVTHETLTSDLILSPALRPMLDSFTPAIPADLLAKLAVGPGKRADVQFNQWEGLLSEIIVGDAFGVDRMDYLLRDSLHAGVNYGRFDQHRLINTLRLLPKPQLDDTEDDADTEVAIGVEVGGLQAAESLLLARYLMFTQVYFHKVRAVYDLHLIAFLAAWLPGGMYPGTLDQHLRMTDSHVLMAMRDAAADPDAPGHIEARRIIRREHARLVFDGRQSDLEIAADPAMAVMRWAASEFGAENAFYKKASKSGGSTLFPVRDSDGSVSWSTTVSDVLSRLPDARYERVYVTLEHKDKAKRLLSRNRQSIVLDNSQLEEQA